jgi:hypothetical protein
MSVENPLWGAPRIDGELLKLGFEVSQTSVAKRMARPAASSFSSDRNNLQKRIRPHMMMWTASPQRHHSAKAWSPERHKEGDRP